MQEYISTSSDQTQLFVSFIATYIRFDIKEIQFIFSNSFEILSIVLCRNEIEI